MLVRSGPVWPAVGSVGLKRAQKVPLRATVLPMAEKTPPPERQPSLRTALSRMNDDHLMCRDFGHSWRPFQARYIPQRKQYEERLKCLRCKTIRVRLLTHTGGQVANHYVYPDGYAMKGYGRLSGTDRDAVRLASLQTVLELSGVETIDPRSRNRTKRSA